MDNRHQVVWGNCLKIIRESVPAISFKTWFEPIVPTRLENNVLTIQVPSPFFYEYLEEQYIDILRTSLRKVLGVGAKLEYNILVENSAYSNTNTKACTLKFPGKNREVPANKPLMPMDGKEKSIKNPFVIPGIQKLQIDPQLNPENRIESFIEGECNRLARSAGCAVAQKPGGTAFNPLFLYGAPGLGKTHLAQSIGIEVKEKHPDKIVLYVSANKFQTQFVEAIRNNNKNDFIHFYQMIDVLIIDDVQEFAGKEKTQDTFFHIFNHLHQSNKQLILTSDKPPSELKGLEQRLLSRFKWGLAADLQVPDYETRMAILNQKAYRDGMEIDNVVIEYIASYVQGNVRELEGTLISLLAQATLNQKEITLSLAKNVVEKLVKNTKKEVTIDSIQQAICEYFNMEVSVLQSRTRKREIVQARQIAMYFAKSKTKASLASIGAQIGGKDHATVLHACKTVANLVETDKRFKTYIDEIEKRLSI